MEKQNLPNATLILVMGILSIVGACCYALPGFLFGIIGMVLAVKDTKLYKQDPDIYQNYGNVQAGKIMSIIGLILSVLFIVVIIGVIMYIGWDVLQDPELLQERLEELENL